jgi:ABC-2 type transport system ATP-binding protein
MTTALSGPALDVAGLVKHYGRVQALRGIDLRVEPGEIFGFLGPNGAGKSTAIRVILDLIRPTAGRAEVLGHDCQRDSVVARRLMGYLPSDPAFPLKLTADEVFDYVAAVRGVEFDRGYREDLVRRLSLDTSRPVSTLSRGNRQKVGLIQALLPRPPLVILDEPTTGLDPLIQNEVEAILREVAAEGRTVFFSSHILAEVETICSRAAIVRDGLIVDVFDLAEQRRLAPVHVEVSFAEPPPPDALSRLPGGVQLVEHAGQHLVFAVRDGFDPLVKWLAGFTVESLVAREATLEELFIRHYRSEGDGPDRAGESAS